MPASLRKYYKRSHRLILTRYSKLKNENRKACDLMLLYNDDLRAAHPLKEWFYDICQSYKYSYQWGILGVGKGSREIGHPGIRGLRKDIQELAGRYIECFQI